jgi:hypothetical protein
MIRRAIDYTVLVGFSTLFSTAVTLLTRIRTLRETHREPLSYLAPKA